MDIFKISFLAVNMLLVITCIYFMAGTHVGITKMTALFTYVNEIIEEKSEHVYATIALASTWKLFVLIIGSAFLTALSVLALLGVLLDKVPLLLTYTIIMCVFLITAMGLCISAFTSSSLLGDLVPIVGENQTPATNQMDKLDFVQYEFKCCGIKGPHDYLDSSSKLPASCCPGDDQSCTEVKAWPESCHQKVISIGEQMQKYIKHTVIATTVLVLLTLVFSCYMNRRVHVSKLDSGSN